MTVLDPRDPAQRDAVDEVIELRFLRSAKDWVFIVMMLLALLSPVVAFQLESDIAAFRIAPILAVLACFAVFSLALRAHRAWRIPELRPGTALRRWTSTPRVALAICLAFVPIAHEVGLDALAFSYAQLDEPWRIVTSAFTHGGPFHLIGNMLGLLAFGTIVDARVGRALTAFVLAVTIVAAALAQAFSDPTGMIGFSGAVYGLIGATLVLAPRMPQLLAFHTVVVPVPTWAWTLVTVPILTAMAASDEGTNIAWVAHVGGFIAGAVVALPMRWLREPVELQEVVERRRALARRL